MEDKKKFIKKINTVDQKIMDIIDDIASSKKDVLLTKEKTDYDFKIIQFLNSIENDMRNIFKKTNAIKNFAKKS
jgi:hypothetical protein